MFIGKHEPDVIRVNSTITPTIPPPQRFSCNTQKAKVKVWAMVNIVAAILVIVPTLSIWILELGDSFFGNKIPDEKKLATDVYADKPLRIGVIHSTGTLNARISACVRQIFDIPLDLLLVSEQDNWRTGTLNQIKSENVFNTPVQLFSGWFTTIAESQIATRMVLNSLWNHSSIQADIFHCSASNKEDDINRWRKIAMKDSSSETESMIRTHFVPADLGEKDDSLLRKAIKNYVSFFSKNNSVHFIHKVAYSHGRQL